MIPLADFIQVSIIYIVIGLALCLPPLILPQWKRLLKKLNDIEIKNKNRIVIPLFLISIAIIIITIVLISLFNANLFRLKFDDINQESEFFHVFALFTFFLMPLSMAFIASTTYINNTPHPKLGNFFILLFAFNALAMAGSFYHDLLWCDTVTDWYTKRVEGNYDFDI